MSSQLDLEQLRKQAKELVRARKAAGRPIKLTEAQLELARGQGFASWPKLKAHVERLGAEQPFHTDIEYYEGRADGIATVGGVTVAEARLDLARRHGFASWSGLRRHVEALRDGLGAADAVHARLPRGRGRRPRAARRRSSTRTRSSSRLRGTNGNDLLGMADGLPIVRLLLERGADPNRGNDYGWTKLHQAGYANRRELAQVMLDAGGRLDVSARGDGGTPLIAALFWGHREVVDLLGVEPGNLRVAAGLGLLDADPRACRHAGGGGPPRLLPAPRRLPGVAAVGRPAGGARRGARLGGEERPRRGAAAARRARRARRRRPLSRHGARVGGGRTGASSRSGSSSRLGADPNRRGTFGGPDHGEGVTALHLAAQAGRREAVEALLELGADPTLRDAHLRRPCLRLGRVRRPRGRGGAAARRRGEKRLTPMRTGPTRAAPGRPRRRAAVRRRARTTR